MLIGVDGCGLAQMNKLNAGEGKRRAAAAVVATWILDAHRNTLKLAEYTP